jgi:hypothetical protein
MAALVVNTALYSVGLGFDSLHRNLLFYFCLVFLYISLRQVLVYHVTMSRLPPAPSLPSHHLQSLSFHITRPHARLQESVNLIYGGFLNYKDMTVSFCCLESACFCLVAVLKTEMNS